MFKKIAVLCGGDGAEREVSLDSGAAVYDALCQSGANTEKIILSSLKEAGTLRGKFDFAFIAMHGDWGEDGRLQSELEKMEMAYSGSRPKACSTAMNKDESLKIFRQNGLTVPEGALWGHDGFTTFSSVMERLGERLVIKPCSAGSTVGVSILFNPTESIFVRALDEAGRYGSDILIEEYIEGHEITVAVLERSGAAFALPIIEIVPESGFYDYKNKYTQGATRYIVPASIDEHVREKLEAAALTAHISLGCRAYSRSDFRLSGEGIPYILEINTSPGMTNTSLVPKAAKAAGLSFAELVHAIILAS